MKLSLQTVFESPLLAIRYAQARPSAQAISEIETETADLLLLPLTGVFAKHDKPGQHYIANPNHALLLAAQQPYRISFPDQRGDESLVLEFAPAVLQNLLNEMLGVDKLATPRLAAHGLLQAPALLQRQGLWLGLQAASSTTLEVESSSLMLGAAALQAASCEPPAIKRNSRSLTLARQQAQVEHVKALISLAPANDWSLAKLATEVHTTPFHLLRIFRQQVGITVHQYQLRSRLLQALAAMREGQHNLTEIALAAGFAQHSHFSSSFRALFGFPPSAWYRRLARKRF